MLGFTKSFNEVKVQPPIASIADLEKLFPGCKKPCTDQGYECGFPWYLEASADCFSDTWDWQKVVAYDCKTCGGIIIGKPLDAARHLQEVRVLCRYCGSEIFQEDLVGV